MAGRRFSDLKRRRPRREPRKRFFIFCEGKNTEPEYFGALRRLFATALIEIETVGQAGVPFTLVSAAVSHAKSLGLAKSSRKMLESFEEKDEVWAVFDRDDHPRFEDAVALCQKEGIGIGRSNPCFELWLILHVADYDKPDGREVVQKQCGILCPEYKKSGRKTPDCSKLLEYIVIAEDRAEVQLRRREEEDAPYGPPSTTVGRLTRTIRNAAQKAQPS